MHARRPWVRLRSFVVVALGTAALACGDDTGGAGDGGTGAKGEGGVDTPLDGALVDGGTGGPGGGGDGGECELGGDAGDADGDGRTNGEEREGYQVQIDSSGFGLEDLSLLEERHVDSDPCDTDSDGDGLDDGEEYLGRSDPRDPDSDGDGLDDGVEVTRWMTSAISVDSDGDARAGDAAPDPDLFDGAELALVEDPDTGDLVPGVGATSPSLADTDGDGVDDTEEVGSAVRSAVLADLPSIGIDLVDDVDIRLHVVYTDDTSTTEEYGATISSSMSSELSRSDGTSTALSAELSATVGVEAQAGLPPTATVSASVTATVGIERTVSTEVTQTTAQEFGQEHSRMQSEAVGRSVSTEGGSLAVGIRVTNTGTIAYHLDNLGITVRQFLSDENRTRSLTVLPLPAAFSDGFTLGAGKRTAVIPFTSDELPADLMRSFLRNPSSLTFEPAGFDLKNADGTSFTFLTEATFERTALLVLDAGDGSPRTLRPATNVNRDDEGALVGVPLGAVLEAAEVAFKTEKASTGRIVLTEVEGVEATVHPDDGPDLGDPPYPKGREPGMRRAKRFWALFAAREKGEVALDRDFQQILLENRDELHVAYVRDDDQDGVSDREEFLRGALDSTPHSDGDTGDPDGDGLSDWFEMKVGWTVTTSGADLDPYPVLPSPALVDGDGDGLDDHEEHDAGTDPGVADTDQDGLGDATDSDPLTFQNTAPTFATVDVTVTGATATATADVDDAEDNVVSVTIDWGDGSADTVLTTGFDAVDEQHVYSVNGSYNVTVRATDLGGLTVQYMEGVMPTTFPGDAILHLTLDGNTTNSGSEIITVSASNVTSYVGDRDAVASKAADLYNSGSSGSGGIIGTTNLNLGSNVTFSIWVKHDGTFGNNVNFFGVGNWFTIYSTSSKMRFGPVTSNNPDESLDDPAEVGNLPTGVWRHYVGVVAQTSGSTSESRFYVNGALIGMETFNTLQADPTACRVHLGSPAQSGNYCTSSTSDDTMNNFNGAVDDVRIYRRALTSAEVTALYAE
jgi:hypothetical protein